MHTPYLISLLSMEFAIPKTTYDMTSLFVFFVRVLLASGNHKKKLIEEFLSSDLRLPSHRPSAGYTVPGTIELIANLAPCGTCPALVCSPGSFGPAQ